MRTPQRFYLDEISLHAAVTTGEEAWKCPVNLLYKRLFVSLPLTRRRKSTYALYTSLHYSWDITVC